MALVAHRMMLPARHRRTTQQVARNKVGVLLVPSVADYYGGDACLPTATPLPTPLPTPAVSQLNLQPDPAEPAVDGSGSGKVSATRYSIRCVAAYEEVDGRQRDSSHHLTHEESCKRDVTNIILSAQKEHEERIRHQVIATMKQRADQELVKRRDINPFPQSLIRDPMVYDEEVRALLELAASMEDNGDNDGDDEDF